MDEMSCANPCSTTPLMSDSGPYRLFADLKSMSAFGRRTDPLALLVPAPSPRNSLVEHEQSPWQARTIPQLRAGITGDAGIVRTPPLA
jgi:hypothetical protein